MLLLLTLLIWMALPYGVLAFSARKARKVVIWPGILLVLVTTLILAQLIGGIFGLIGMTIGFYQAFNLYRGLRNASLPQWSPALRQTAIVLAATQTLLVAVNQLLILMNVSVSELYLPLLIFQLFVAGGLAATVRHNLQKTSVPRLENYIPATKLPSLSVCIPARNETADLEECLQSLLASRYPKLEILVLDDCSQNPRTPEIIRQFAHDGVRFLAGKAPPENWLAKNFAYEQLYKQATGEIVLFCGVDVRFKPDSLKLLVTNMLNKSKSMLSVIPANRLPPTGGLEAVLVQPVRYAWELVLPRKIMRNPPFLSSCWLIRAENLERAGGFKGFARSVLPELHLARRARQLDDGYSFMQSNDEIGIYSSKNLAEQRLTAIRTRYAQLHRRPELVALLTAAEAGVLLLPCLELVWSVVTGNIIASVISFGTVSLLIYSYVTVVGLTYRTFIIRSLALLPFAVLYDIALLHLSMWRYECGRVVWKDRDICVPLMRVYPSLPALDSAPRP